MVQERVSFRKAFCLQHRCDDESFERVFFWRGLYRHAVPVAFFIRWISPQFFRDDFELIRWLGGDGNLREVAEDIEQYEYGNRVRRHWLRTGLRIHLNPARVADLTARCLEA